MHTVEAAAAMQLSLPLAFVHLPQALRTQLTQSRLWGWLPLALERSGKWSGSEAFIAARSSDPARLFAALSSARCRASSKAASILALSCLSFSAKVSESVAPSPPPLLPAHRALPPRLMPFSSANLPMGRLLRPSTST